MQVLTLVQNNSVPPLISDSSSMATIAPTQHLPSRDAGPHLIQDLNLNSE